MATPQVLLLSAPLQQTLSALFEACAAEESQPLAASLVRQAGGIPTLMAWLVSSGAVDAALAQLAGGVAQGDGAWDEAWDEALNFLTAGLIEGALRASKLSDSLPAAVAEPLERHFAAFTAAGWAGDRVPTPAQRIAQLQQALVPARQLADVLLSWYRQPAQLAATRLELARAAAARSCAHLRCPNLVLEGGPAAGQGTGCKRCGRCRAVYYCGIGCSHANWRSHRKVCAALAAERRLVGQQAAAAGSSASDLPLGNGT
ncbi:hypothetical protein ABPG75_010601 [Micractinium tetrahymenae]